MKQTVKETRLADVILTEDCDSAILEGYAIVFNQETLIGDEENGFIEVIDSNALNKTLMKDVPMKYNHADSFLIIARTKNGSLKLSVDEIGLKVHAKLIDTNSNQDIYKMVKSGLLDKMSFAFTVREQTWDRSGKLPKRIITDIERLYEVSIVDMPAYEGTSIYSRSLDLVDSILVAMDLAENEKKQNIVKSKIRIKTKY